MPFTYKILGQSAPAATTYTKIYTAPASTSAVISTLSVANLGEAAAAFRVFVCPASQTAATPAASQAVAFNVTIDGNSSAFFTIGATLATGEYVTVWSSNASVSFSVFGSEIT